MWRRDRVVVGWLWLVLLAALVSGCATLAGVDRTFLQKLDGLKTYQMSFIDEFTAGPGKQWDQAKLQGACEQGNSLFQEAAAYAEGKGGDRKAQVDLLHDVFKKNCEILGRGSLLSPAASAQLKEEVQSNFADAIAGECSHASGSPATC
jgi:hypothetical protein